MHTGTVTLREFGCVSTDFDVSYNQVKESNIPVYHFIDAFRIVNGSFVDDPLIIFKEVALMLCGLSFVADLSACDDKCLSSCDEYKYSNSVTSASWPDFTIMSSLYE